VPSPSIRWEKRAVKELASLPRESQQTIATAVERLREEPFKGERLAAEWRGLRRLPVGIYGIIYAFDGDFLLILDLRAGERREVDRQG
jgi:mRNA-degrading endonuclease RelE of RelBE toxin-antitoxin system